MNGRRKIPCRAGRGGARLRRDGAVWAMALLAAAAAPAQDGARRLTLVHTNDIQSRLLGFAPNRDYTPETQNDDATVGGISRMATVIREVRARSPESTLTVDGGDILMGTLFQTLGEAHGAELRLMQRIGYDAATLGNHEFDFRSDGLARIVTSARRGGEIPQLLLANIRFDPEDPGDDELARLFDDGVLKRWTVVERGGLRIGLFGLLGRHASEVSAYARPARFDDPVETAREMTAILRQEEDVDLVVALSHGGVKKIGPRWFGDDVELLREIPGLDVVVGGHTHTPLFEPILIDGRPAVQAGSECQFVGVLELEVTAEGSRVLGYELVPIDDSVASAPDVEAEVRRYEELVDQEVLAPYGLSFRDPVVETAFDLIDDRVDASRGNLGPFVADAIRWMIDRHVDEPTDASLTTAGLIRDSMIAGATGLQQTSDVFRVLPLGIGTVETTPGYPLARIYLTGPELKMMLEVLLVGHRFKGKSYYPFFSGLRFGYNPRRVFLDQVYSVELGDDERGYTEVDLEDGSRLYSLGLNGYFLSYMHYASELSLGLFEIAPRDATGQPFATIEAALIDADRQTPGVQEVKEWLAVVEYAKQLGDVDGDGVADMPERYRVPLTRRSAVASLRPALLFKNATGIMWTASLVVALGVSGIAFVVVRRVRRRRAYNP